jgi:predicted Zn-dependent protease
VSSPSDFDRALAPLLALRQRYPNDLWVNERYQDAVQQYGIEGHLRKLTEEYQVLSMQHPDETMYSYLYARSLMGRNTSAAAQQMTEIVADHPDLRRPTVHWRKSTLL